MGPHAAEKRNHCGRGVAKSGLRNGHFGKWHLGSVRADSEVAPGKNGFDEWASAPNFYDNNPLFSHNGKVIETEGESSDITVDLALKWMAKVKDKPFLAVVWFGSPHGPHQGGEEFLKQYKDEPKAMANFYAEITGMDAAMGELRAGIRKLGVAENTVLWYCSDNGGLKPNSMGGLSGKKGSLLEGGLRVPAIIEWPSVIKKNRITRVPANTVDIYPTVLELAGVKQPDPQPVLDGVSLAKLLRGEKFERAKSMGFWNYKTGGRSMHARRMLEELRREQLAGETNPAPKAGVCEQRISDRQIPARGRVDFRRLETASHPPQKWNFRAVQTLQRSPRQGREIGSRPRAARAPHPHENRTRRMAKNRAPQPQRRRLRIAPIISPRATPAHRLGARSRRRDPFFPGAESECAE